jgi:hypothetical protein
MLTALLRLASSMQTVSLSLRDPKYIPVFTAELPSISTLSTATETRVSPVDLTISRRLEMVNPSVGNLELRMISHLMKKMISLNNQM